MFSGNLITGKYETLILKQNKKLKSFNGVILVIRDDQELTVLRLITFFLRLAVQFNRFTPIQWKRDSHHYAIAPS